MMQSVRRVMVVVGVVTFAVAGAASSSNAQGLAQLAYVKASNTGAAPNSLGRITRRTTARWCVSSSVNSTAGVASGSVAVLRKVKSSR